MIVSCDLDHDHDPMTLIYEIDLYFCVPKMNVLARLGLSKVMALQTRRQTDGRTERQIRP